MVFNWQAAKAYVGGIIAAAAPTVTGWVVGIVHTSMGFDLPTSVQQTLTLGLSFVFGWVGVYFTKNATA